ncbi:MAG: hypothetical protein IJU84_00385, partial [Clostridia bacterium]|nr:hypothetical protein [Clostridia bacterium]
TDNFSNSPREPFFSRLSGSGLLVAMRHIAAPCTGGDGTVILNVAERNEESLYFNGDFFISSSRPSDSAWRDPAVSVILVRFLDFARNDDGK